MRQYQFNANLSMDYPERDIWLRDNNTVTLRASNSGSKVGAVVTVTNMATGESRILNHNSELPTLVFPLRDTLQWLYGGDPNQGMSYTFSVRAWLDNQYAGEYAWRSEMANGVSLPFRAHGACRTIYLYSATELAKVGLYANTAGMWSVNGLSTQSGDGFVNLNFTGAITEPGEHTLSFTAQTGGAPSADISVVSMTPYDADAVLEFTEDTVPVTPVPVGTEWSDSGYMSDGYDTLIVYDPSVCDNNSMEFRYLNTDGQIRHIKGRILQTTMESKGTAYRRVEPSVYANVSRRVINSETAKVTVIFEDVRRDAYLDEIEFSPEVQFMRYDGEWMPCTVATSKLVNDRNETADWKVEFLLSSDTAE